MKNILVLGLGKVGTLVGVLLSKNFNVSGLDQNKPHYDLYSQLSQYPLSDRNSSFLDHKLFLQYFLF